MNVKECGVLSTGVSFGGTELDNICINFFCMINPYGFVYFAYADFLFYPKIFGDELLVFNYKDAEDKDKSLHCGRMTVDKCLYIARPSCSPFYYRQFWKA